MRSMLARLLVPAVLLVATSVIAADADQVLGEVVVPDRSADARAAALPQALAVALGRLTPDAEPGQGIDLQAALVDHPTLLHRFEYVQVTRPTASGIPSIRLMLRAWFDAVPARDLLVRAGRPVWRGGAVRPAVWLVEDDGSGPRLLDGGQHPELASWRDRLRARGVEPLFALNDLSDWRMTENLNRAAAPAVLAEAAARAAAPLALLAWVGGGDDGVGVDWWLHADGQERRFSSSGADLAAAAEAGSDRLLALLAELHAVRPGAIVAAARGIDRGPGEYVLWLENLGRAGDYAQAVALLQGQAMVTAVTPEQAAGDRVRLRLVLSAPLGQLLALLAADGRLEQSAQPQGDADLALRWRD